MNKIALSWPPSCLSPNSRKDRRFAKKDRDQIRNEWWAGAKAVRFPASQHLRITFHPPDARRRDLDNCLGSVKYGLDGLAQATGQDDSEWALTIRMGALDRPNGSVVVECLSSGSEATAQIPLRGTIS